MPLQAAQAQVQRLCNAFGAWLAVWQLRLDGGAHLAFPGQRLQLGEGALEHGFVVFGQLRVGVVQMAVEIAGGEFQAVFVGGKPYRRAKYPVPRLGVGGFRAPQVNGQRRIVATQAVATGAYVDRRKGINRFRRGRGAAWRLEQAKTVDVAVAAQLQVQGITDHLVIAHDALEHLAQAAAGHQCVTQRMKGGGADKPRHPQPNRRVATGLYRQRP